MPSFDWEEFLNLAEELVQRRGSTAAERTAISRAYYAAFHTASDYVIARGGRLTFRGTDHTLVWDWFLQSAESRPSRWIGTTGHRLRRSRRQADYDAISPENLSTEAQTAVQLARRIIIDVRPR